MAEADLQIAPMEHQDNQDGPGVGRVSLQFPIENRYLNNLTCLQQVLDAQVAAEREQYQPSPMEKVMSIVKSMFMRGMIIYFIMQVFRRPQQAAQPGTGVTGGGNGPVSNVGAASNLFQNGTLMDLYVYVSEQKDFGDFNNSEALVWKKEELWFGDWYSGEDGDGVHSFSKTLKASENLQNNGSIYLHTFIVRAGKSPDPSTGKGRFSKKWTVYKTRQLNKFMKKHYKKTANLLTGETEATEHEKAKVAEGVKQEVLSHWHPNITVNLVFDYTGWVPGQVPPPLDEFVEFTPSLREYKPIMYINDYWNLKRDYMPLNETVSELNFTVTFQPLSMFKWQMYSAQQMKNK